MTVNAKTTISYRWTPDYICHLHVWPPSPVRMYAERREHTHAGGDSPHEHEEFQSVPVPKNPEDA